MSIVSVSDDAIYVSSDSTHAYGTRICASVLAAREKLKIRSFPSQHLPIWNTISSHVVHFSNDSNWMQFSHSTGKFSRQTCDQEVRFTR